MSKIAYISKRFSRESMAIISHAIQIVEEFKEEGYDLTLRQLYYQFVGRDLLANTVKNYRRLGSVISNARRAGYIDWESIVDRTRELHRLANWDGPENIVQDSAAQYLRDVWENLPLRVEVWIEKDALLGVFERVCDGLRVPLLSCRGFASDSEVWRAAQRFINHENQGHKVYLLHFSDHDPSGLEMTKDIRKRLDLFEAEDVCIKRLALTKAQVKEHRLPPNPARESDSRFKGYLREYGEYSWELDALKPQVLANLVTEQVKLLLGEYKDAGKMMKQALKQEADERELLEKVSEHWDWVAEGVSDR